jgi:hypothetical protein
MRNVNERVADCQCLFLLEKLDKIFSFETAFEDDFCIVEIKVGVAKTVRSKMRFDSGVPW